MNATAKRSAAVFASGLLFAGAGMFTAMEQAYSAEVRGKITFENGSEIPKGNLKLFFEPSAKQNEAQAVPATLQFKSAGKSTVFTYTLPTPINIAASSPLLIVAQLERKDGWLLARGSTKVKAGEPANITLYTAMY